MEYNHKELEPRIQEFWRENDIYRVDIDKTRPKYYVLDMFPYPSGAGLHVGHPLGYIASDIYARYKRLQGFNVLHPMGFDAYGLPAEQYAIRTGQHPEVTTRVNIERYISQLNKIGFSFDWNRKIRTCDPEFYKWTQWAFLKMFGSWYDNNSKKARPIEDLIKSFETSGTEGINAACTKERSFSAEEWQNMDKKAKSDTLMNYRMAYLANTMVNWCPKLGTVLANDEVTDGVSVNGGFPVVQKEMWQWCLRVSAYAQRLLDSLDDLQWSDSIKETQRNWIGRSEGAEMRFAVADHDFDLEIFTTRADTVFGVTFMVLAPESKYVSKVTTAEQQSAVDEYLAAVRLRTERERMIDRRVTGVFSGSYAINPLSGTKVPIWISDYVLAGYGTGAIMAVPAHDSRDYAFARHFNLPIIPLIEGADVSESSFDAKEGKMINSCGPELDLNGLDVKEAIARAKEYVEKAGIGKVKVNYRLRDAIFSRQRYWGEPIPICYVDGIPTEYNQLPLELPEISSYLPTETGEPPLGRAENWKTPEGFPLELNTMPGFAGSSAYYLRYEDPRNSEALVSTEANSYWRNVDLYIGGSEHATGHLIYSRFWNKFLFDYGCIADDEPFRKLINQGMIQGKSNFVYLIPETNTYVSAGLRDQYTTVPRHVDINLVDSTTLELDQEAFRKWLPEFANAEFILEDGKYICGSAVEKMSKSMFNVVNPDDVVDKYGADTLRLYEMFLGPLEQSKPWDTNGIDGVYRFLKKLWALFYKGDTLLVDNSKPTKEDLKSLHKLIKKVTSDIEGFSFNTSVAAFMICVNELDKANCHSADILADLLVLLAPFAPHMTEELWHSALNRQGTICDAAWPKYNEEYLRESTVTMAVSFNGKTRFNITLPADASKEDIEKAAIADPQSEKWLEGKTIKKVIVVPGKIINIVVA